MYVGLDIIFCIDLHTFFIGFIDDEKLFHHAV